MSARPRSRGFTLIELMVTVTILAIMMGIGIPSFRTFLANQRIKSASTELMASVLISRSEAIKRNATVNLTPLNSTTWAGGWTVTTVQGTTTIDVHRQQSLDGVTITQKNASNTAVSPSAVSFGSTGRPAAKAYFQISGVGDAVRCIKLDAIGIPTSTSGSCS